MYNILQTKFVLGVYGTHTYVHVLYVLIMFIILIISCEYPGIEPRTQRYEPQMPKYTPFTPPEQEYTYDPFNEVYYEDMKHTLKYENSFVLNVNELDKNDEMGCFTSCNQEDLCKSWSYDTVSRVCSMFSDVRMNGHMDSAFSGVKVH